MKLAAALIVTLAAGAWLRNAGPWLFTREALWIALAVALVAPLAIYGRVGLMRIVGLALLRAADLEESRQQRYKREQRDGLRALAETGMGLE